LIEGTETFGSASGLALRSVERGIVDMLGTTVSKLGAGPLAGLLGQPAPGIGEGVGAVFGGALSRWIFGLPPQVGQTAASGANTAALAANTAALTALTGTLGASAAAPGRTTRRTTRRTTCTCISTALPTRPRSSAGSPASSPATPAPSATCCAPTRSPPEPCDVGIARAARKKKRFTAEDAEDTR